MKNKKINFYPLSKWAESLAKEPSAAIKNIPEWYKKTKSNISGDKDQIISPKGGINLTIKSCLPVFDAMTAGYFIYLPCDIQVVDRKMFNGQKIIWMIDKQLVSSHPAWQSGELYIPKEYDQEVFKWHMDWQIETPSGYSCLVVHPMYRNDLPFFTLPAIVDTDKFKNSFNLPFLIRKDFVGIIPAGTPIAQIIPIKREGWKSQINDFKNDLLFNSDKKMIFLSKAYKNNWWNRKEYK